MGFPGDASGKEPCLPVQERLKKPQGSIPGSGRSPGGEQGNPLQYSCLENPMDRGAWQAIVHWITKSWASLKWLGMHIHVPPYQVCWEFLSRRDVEFCRVCVCLPCIEMIVWFLTFMLLMWHIILIYLHMLSHFYISGINIPWLWCMILLTYYWIWFASILLWRRQWHPTPVLLPGKSHGRRILVGCRPWGR